MKIIENMFNGFKFAKSVKSTVDTGKDLISFAQNLFALDNGDDIPVIAKSILPTKYGGWRKNDSCDLRGVSRKRLENMRTRFDLAVGREFDLNKNTDLRNKTKLDFLGRTLQSYCVYELLQTIFFKEDVFYKLAENILDFNEKNIFLESKKQLKEILDKLKLNHVLIHSLTSKQSDIKTEIENIRKTRTDGPSQSKEEVELYDRMVFLENEYIQISQTIQENNLYLNENLVQLETIFRSILEKTKSLILPENEDSEVKNFVLTCQGMNFQNFFNAETLEFIYFRDALKQDPELEYRVATFLYRVLYDPVSCYDLILSMGSVGKAFVASLGTRSYFFNWIHSRKHLPDSAIVFLKMLGIKKENLRLIEGKYPKKILNGSEVSCLKLTTIGGLLYQEVENFFPDNASKCRSLISLFGKTRQEKGDKYGYISSVWDEIDSRWDSKKNSISYYLKSTGVLKSTDLIEREQDKLFKSLKIIEENKKISQVNSFENKLNLQIEEFIRIIEELIPIKKKLSLNFDDNLLNNLKSIRNEILNKKINLLDYYTMRENFSESLYHFMLDRKGSPILKFANTELFKDVNKFILQSNLENYYRYYDIHLNQIVKMSFSFLDPSGALPFILEQSKSKISFLRDLIFQEVSKIKMNPILKKIQEICLDQNALISLIFCHNEYLSLEKKDGKSQAELSKILKEIFFEKVTAHFMSNSLNVSFFMMEIDFKFQNMLVNLLKNKNYSYFSKIMKFEVNCIDGKTYFYSLEELGKLCENIKFKANSLTEIMSELLQKNCVSVKLGFSEDKIHCKIASNLESAMSDVNCLFEKIDVVKNISYSIDLYQRMSMLTLVYSIVIQFGLSNKTSLEIKNLFEDIMIDKNQNKFSLKNDLNKELYDKIKSNEILQAILKKITTLNTTKKGKNFLAKEHFDNTRGDGVGGWVAFESVFLNGPVSSQLIESTEQHGGIFFYLFKFILEKLGDMKINHSVEFQLMDEPNFRIKIEKISSVFLDIIVSFSLFIQNNLASISQIIWTLDSVSEVFGDALENREQPLKSKSLDVVDFFYKIKKINKFSDQIIEIENMMHEKIGLLESQLVRIFEFFKHDRTFQDKSDFLNTLYCSENVSEAFEKAFFNSVQLHEEEVNLKRNCFFGSDFLCRFFMKSVSKNRELIFIQDAHPYRIIFGDKYGSFLEFFFQFQMKSGLHSSIGSEDILKTITLWSELNSEMKKLPYFFKGYYLRGSGFSQAVLEYLQKRVKNNEYNLSEVQEKEFKLVLDLVAKTKENVHSIVSFYNQIGSDELQTKNAYDPFQKIEEEFFVLNSKISLILKDDFLSIEQYNLLISEILYIDDIKKFNTYFFKIGHFLVQKMTISSKNDCVSNTTDYEEHLNYIRKNLINFRRHILELEKKNVLCQRSGKILPILSSSSSFFEKSKSLSPYQVQIWKKDFLSYKFFWNSIYKKHTALRNNDFKNYLSIKIDTESKRISEIEKEILILEALLNIETSDFEIGPLLYKEISLYLFLKKSNSFEIFERLSNFISQRDLISERCQEDIFSAKDIKDLSKIASDLEKCLSYFLKSSEFDSIKEIGIIRSAFMVFSEWLYSSNKTHELQIQLNVKNTADLKQKVKSLLDLLIIKSSENLFFDFSALTHKLSILQIEHGLFENYLDICLSYEKLEDTFHALKESGVFIFYEKKFDYMKKELSSIYRNLLEENFKDNLSSTRVLVKNLSSYQIKFQNKIKNHPFMRQDIDLLQKCLKLANIKLGAIFPRKDIYLKENCNSIEMAKLILSEIRLLYDENKKSIIFYDAIKRKFIYRLNGVDKYRLNFTFYNKDDKEKRLIFIYENGQNKFIPLMEFSLKNFGGKEFISEFMKGIRSFEKTYLLKKV